MKPDLNFRANPARSINVFGTLTDSLVNSVAIEILRLRSISSDPLTIFVNSNGGSTRSLEILEGLLRTSDVDGKHCRIITVAMGNAGSAAATLLASGDYAIAYPSAKIHFHGVRLSDAKEVTMERASDLATWLKDTNNSTAIRLAESFAPRLVFHYSRLKEEFDKIPRASGKTNSEVDCFANCLRDRLSPVGNRIVEKALRRWRSIQDLSAHVFTKLQGEKIDSETAYEASILREIVDYEVKQNAGKDWTLNAQGIGHVVEDYTILRDYHTGEHNNFLQPLAETFSPAFMSPSEIDAFTKADDEAKVKLKQKLAAKILQPFWYFTVSLCRHLQEEENALTNEDAYWLGAVDEIVGSGLPCIRDLMETNFDQLELKNST